MSKEKELSQKQKELSQKQKRYEVALDTRKFEIELFWKRSLFFWGFVSVAFVGYFNTPHYFSHYQLLISSFGFVLSFGWSLANRGGKYWQENWEMVIDKIDKEMTNDVFKERETVSDDRCCWLKARKFSVSRITIAISDFTTIIWFLLLVKNANIFEIPMADAYKFVFPLTILFVIVMLFATLSKDTETKK